MSTEMINAFGNAIGGPVGGAIGSILGGFFGSNAQSDAANQAAQARTDAINKGLSFQQQSYGNALNQQQGQFNANQAFQVGQLNNGLGLSQQQLAQLQSIFSPLQGAGATGISGMGQLGQGGLQAFQQQLGLSGALGSDAQTQAISGIQNSPMFQALSKQGEDAILQNASATGGLHGGNVQAALAQFQPALLNQQLQQQYANLGGLSALGSQNFGNLAQLGQAGASGLAQGGLGVLGQQLGLTGQISGNVGNLGSQYANTIGSLTNANSASILDLLNSQGAANASNALAQGSASSNFWNTAGGAINQANVLNALQNRARQPLGGFGSPQQAPAPLAFGSQGLDLNSLAAPSLGNYGVGQFFGGQY